MREKASYRVVILKRAFSATSRKTIVRKLLKCVVLTIIDSDVLKDSSRNRFFMRCVAIIIGLVIGKHPATL